MAVDWNTREEAAFQVDDKWREAVKAKADATLSDPGRAQRIDAAEAVHVAEVVREGGDADAAVRSATQGQPRSCPCPVPIVG